MRANVGPLDRFVRLIFALIIVFAGYKLALPEFLSFTLYVIGGLLFITSIISWCPFYFTSSHSTRSGRITKISKKDIEMAVKEHSFKESAPLERIKPEKVKKKEVKKKTQTKKPTTKKKEVKKTSKTKKTTS